MNSNKTDKKDERRFTDRFKIPEGITYFRYLRRYSLVNNFLGPFPMYDIASNSARFECPKEISVDTEIEMKIVPPGYEKELRIKGKIIRQVESAQSYGTAYVVQFSPFGKGHKYNTYQCKSSLRQYIQMMKAQK